MGADFASPITVKVAVVMLCGTRLAVALVESHFTRESGALLTQRLKPHFPALPIMFVSLEDNGFRAYASFQTAELLAMLQLSALTFAEIDLAVSPSDDSAIPF